MVEDTRPPMNLPYRLGEPIETERLMLRRLSENDLDVYADYHGRADVSRYLLRDPQTREEAHAELAGWVSSTTLEKTGDMIFFGVQLRWDPTLIGEVPIKIFSVENQTAEIGWIFHPDSHGHGYATEAAEALLTICFDAIGARRVCSYLNAHNEASASICRRIGMRQEAHFVENLLDRGSWEDTAVFAILDREWRARKR